jgi:hypothetical protein
VTYQVLPVSVGAAAGDLWCVDEVTYRLAGRCGPRHFATVRLVEHMTERHGDDAGDWLARHEVWAAQRVDPTTRHR